MGIVVDWSTARSHRSHDMLTHVDPALFVLDLHMKYSGGGTSMYVYCLVSYHDWAAPSV